MGKVRAAINEADNKIEDAFVQLDGVTRAMFIEGVMKEDKVSREEAMILINTNPQYSMGLKWAIYRNRKKLDLRYSRKQKENMFLESLTPEERKLYEEGPGSMSYWAMRRMEKQAEKEANKEAEEIKKKAEESDT